MRSDSSPQAPAPRPLLWSDTALLVYLAGVSVLLHLRGDIAYGYFRDELYYLACSDHLAWGYVDHPPLSIFILAATRAALGSSMFDIRLPVVAAGALSVALTGFLARELGGGRTAQWIAALAYMITGWSLVFASFFSMNAFDVLLWIVALVVAARMLRRQEPRAWVVLGGVFGIGLLNKISMGFLVFGLLVGIALTPSRRLLWNRWLPIGGALAFLLVLPHLVWQLENGLPTLEFMANAASQKITAMSPLAFVAALVVEGNPFTLPFWLTGAGFLLLAPSMRPYRALGFAVAGIFLLFQVQTAKPYYLSPAFPLLFASSGIAIEHLARRRGGWVGAVAGLWLLLGGLVAAPASLPLLPPPVLIRYLAALGIGIPQEERGAPPELPQVLADRLGWENLVATVTRVYDSLPAAERSRCAIVGSNYGEAAAIDFYGRPFGLPHAISGHNNYWLWGPRGFDGRVAIVIGGSPQELERIFERVERADTVVSPHAHPGETNLPIFVCRSLRLPLDEAWKAAKRFV